MWLSPESGTEGQAGSRGKYKVERFEPMCALVAGLIWIASWQSCLCRGRSVSEVALLSTAGMWATYVPTKLWGNNEPVEKKGHVAC